VLNVMQRMDNVCADLVTLGIDVKQVTVFYELYTFLTAFLYYFCRYIIFNNYIDIKIVIIVLTYLDMSHKCKSDPEVLTMHVGRTMTCVLWHMQGISN